MNTTTFVPFENSEIEDLFPPDLLAQVVDRWQRQADVLFESVLKVGEPIVPQIEAWAVSQNIELEDGWKVEVARAVKKRALTMGIEAFDAARVANWVSLFGKFEAQ
ncbi:hypothetical protein M3P36_11655 [Altererythrobacter sp. KTW20L]|uniref:hypothetical protein n=1 Tax=Altererythrobacter sp. KTW20L TaxID=2942210 RepID=UPI0020BDDB0B|nr:hypothetical protein [Altererythrobacter sp. KTW20L]MCL6251691.1 hypothetical protein [Altererythrobacter sp. KTW20L]